ncbi:hypothetical protein ACFLXE_07405 [Chloroflexota bacterium]
MEEASETVKRAGFIGLSGIGLLRGKCMATHSYEVTACGHLSREPAGNGTWL